MQNFKVRFATVSAAMAALSLVSTTGTAFADHSSACCCQGQTVFQEHHAATIQVGDKVVVSGDHAVLMRGTKKLMDVPKGQAVQVTKVQGNWLGTEIEKDGKKISGWIASNQVGSANGQSDRTAGAMPQQGERRSFSYEPSTVQPQAPVYQTYPSYPSYRRSTSPKKEPWQYPKTDPRRYGNGL